MAEFLNPDRLFPADPTTRKIARGLYEGVAALPIVSPHGHTDPSWFADNPNFDDATSLFLTPDHYVLRMLKSQGLSYDDLGVPRKDGAPVAEGRAAWRLFAQNFHLFTGTPSQLWIDHAMQWGFGINERLSADNADRLYDVIGERLKEDNLKPRAVLDKAGIEVIATTEFALDPMKPQERLEVQGLTQRVRTTYRPDDVCDPDRADFVSNLAKLAEMTDCDTADWDGLIEAHRRRRAVFRRFGATATDHGVPTAHTADLPDAEKQPLLDRVLSGEMQAGDAQLFRAQMLTEMAALSVEDGMVMQIHAGVRRNTDPSLFASNGPDKGADIPAQVSPVTDLAPLLNRFGNAPGFRLIFFCLDESVYARELAPMVGYWPALLMGPPWWFHDSPRGIARYLDAMVENAGVYNLAGFNDDTRALLSIPVRHDVWRRGVSAFFADMVARGLISTSEAEGFAGYLSTEAARKAYKMG